MTKTISTGLRSPLLMIFACTITTQGAPSLRSLQKPALTLSKGWARCCVCYLILLWTRDQTGLAPGTSGSPLRKKREGTGHPRVGNARKINSGPSASAQIIVMRL